MTLPKEGRSEQSPKPELVTKLQALFDAVGDELKVKQTNSAAGSPETIVRLVPQLKGMHFKYEDPSLANATINSEGLRTSDESWDDFSIKKEWVSGSVTIDGAEAELGPPLNTYTIERFAWDIGGSGPSAKGEKSFFRYVIDDNGETSTEGIRYGSGHWSEATTPDEAVAEIVQKFQQTHIKY